MPFVIICSTFKCAFYHRPVFCVTFVQCVLLVFSHREHLLPEIVSLVWMKCVGIVLFAVVDSLRGNVHGVTVASFSQ